MLEEKIAELTMQVAELNRLLTRFTESKAQEFEAPKKPESPAPKKPESKTPDDTELRQSALRLAARKGKRYVLELIGQQFGVSQLSQIPDEDKIAALALINEELSKCSESD